VTDIVVNESMCFSLQRDKNKSVGDRMCQRRRGLENRLGRKLQFCTQTETEIMGAYNFNFAPNLS